MLSKEKSLRERMIERAITLDRQMKREKKELDSIKGTLQAEALQELENTNQKYVQYFSGSGSVVVTYKDKFEIDNYPLLRQLMGEELDYRIKKEESVKVTVDDKMKKALIALYREEAKPHDLKEILSWLGIEDKQANVALKKLKGDYAKDLLLLTQLGARGKDGLEEELDAIREQLNYELVQRMIPDADRIDRKMLQRAISLEESLSIGLSYDGGENDGSTEG